MNSYRERFDAWTEDERAPMSEGLQLIRDVEAMQARMPVSPVKEAFEREFTEWYQWLQMRVDYEEREWSGNRTLLDWYIARYRATGKMPSER